MGNSFHQATVASKDIGVMIDYWKAILIELGCQGTLGNSHTNSIGQALSQWTSSCFNTTIF